MTNNYLYKRTIAVNQYINITVPTVGQVLENEDYYYDLVSRLTAMPIDMMVPLNDIGVDFTTISEYQLFLLMFGGMREQDTSLVFGDLKLENFELAVNEQNGEVVMFDSQNDIKIDREIQSKIAAILRKIHHLEKNNQKPANKEAQDFMIERARRKMSRRRRMNTDSQLESLIVAMVNTEQFKYNYEDTLNLTIYQFNESVQQIIKKIDYDNRMYGVYAGTINAKDLNPNDLNWLTHK